MSDLIDRVYAASQFPANTCPASRHAVQIGEALMRGKPYPMLTEEPDHCGESILSVVASLWEARTQIERLTAERDEARAERDAMAKDAERYRFLSCKGVPPYFHRFPRWRLEYWNGEWWDPLMKEELDAAIDAQIEQERSGQAKERT